MCRIDRELRQVDLRAAGIVYWGAVLLIAAGGMRPAWSEEVDPLAAARALEGVVVDAIARAEPAVVAIAGEASAAVLRQADPFDPFGPLPRGPGDEDTAEGAFLPLQFGSGVVVSNPSDPHGRYVLTTCHVVFGESPPSADHSVEVTLHLSERGTVTVRGSAYAADRRIDLAVLRLVLEEAHIAAEDVPTLALGRGEELRKGRFVIALGNPYALARDGSSSATIGIVSNMARRPAVAGQDGGPRERPSIHEYGTLVTVDTRLQLGASGGALLDLDGGLVGLTTSLAALQGYEKSAGFAIPFDEGTRRIVTELLNGHEAEYGFLGISPEPYRGADREGRPLSAVRAAHVSLESPAEQAGLYTGDVIVQINGRAVHEVADLMRIIGLLGPGATAELQVQRGGTQSAVTVTAQLGKWPVYDDRDVLSTRARYPAWRGVSVDYPTARQRFLSSDRLEQYRRAVVVTGVEAGSAAAAAGLKSGDFISSVDGVAVQTPAEFIAAATSRPGAVELTLWEGTTVRVAP